MSAPETFPPVSPLLRIIHRLQMLTVCVVAYAFGKIHSHTKLYFLVQELGAGSLKLL
jgi:hypothetical protein